jgi:hypothetical protein
MNSHHSSEQWLMFNVLNKTSKTFHATRVPSTEKNSSRFFGDNDKELMSHLHSNISIVSSRMLAVRPLPLVATNSVLDHSVSFVNFVK